MSFAWIFKTNMTFVGIGVLMGRVFAQPVPAIPRKSYHSTLFDGYALIISMPVAIQYRKRRLKRRSQHRLLPIYYLLHLITTPSTIVFRVQDPPQPPIVGIDPPSADSFCNSSLFLTLALVGQVALRNNSSTLIDCRSRQHLLPAEADDKGRLNLYVVSKIQFRKTRGNRKNFERD
jgi:hypothetical protein